MSLIEPGQVVYSFLDLLFGAPRKCTLEVHSDSRAEAVEVKIEGGYVDACDAEYAWGGQAKVPQRGSDTDYGLD